MARQSENMRIYQSESSAQPSLSSDAFAGVWCCAGGWVCEELGTCEIEALVASRGSVGQGRVQRGVRSLKRDRLPRKHHSALYTNPETAGTSARFVSLIQMNREMGSRLQIWDLLGLPNSQIPCSRLSGAPGDPSH